MRCFTRDEKVSYAIQFLTTAGEEHATILERLSKNNMRVMDGEKRRGFLLSLEQSVDDFPEQVDPLWAYRKIVRAAAEYIAQYHAPVSAKQVLHKALYALCEDLGKKHCIAGYEEALEILQPPVTEDITIALIKALHARDGITKEEFGQKYHVDARTVQNRIHAIDGNPNHKPLRIGGYAIHVPVKRANEKPKRDEANRYFTPDTLNPVILQMNIIQTATVLQSFQYNYQTGNNIPMDMAIDVWCQLSGYAKARIREVFCKDDPEFSSFLDEVDQASTSLTHHFMTESEMLSESDPSYKERILLAYKGSMICDISLIGPLRTRSNQRILYDNKQKSYYAVSADKLNGERLYFTEEELQDLYESC